ncbi:hypothetical protein GCM10012275_38650 [Longimycelium tulufanense]|uniref:HTH cro/C1-type domain-containing protein n=2 Tax=Longimycelium tulufanense TaxID=907463 RepID=A0A8J3CGN1_9PSEU|nr:hypothetical protein GCM10012275_38650 [Longimycelium tulufanense]
MRREQSGLTLRDLAARCRKAGQPVNPSQLSKIERNICRPRPRLLATLAKALKVPVEALTSGDFPTTAPRAGAA